jgi:hypothetical protein
MQAEFYRDLADENQPVRDAFDERPGKPIKLRIQPSIFRKSAGPRGQYRYWQDVIWNVECDTPEEVLELKDALRVFFQAITQFGPAAVQSELRRLVQAKQGAA